MQVSVKFMSGETRSGQLLAFNINNPVLFLQLPGADGKIVSSSVPIREVQQIIYLRKDPAGDSPVRQEKIDQTILAAATSFRLNVVATSEPQNSEIIREVPLAAHCRVEFAVAYEVYILRNIARHFPDQ